MPYSWENRLKISIFGRSHEKEIGAELSGIPAGERIDYAALQAFMRRRAPGYSEYTTARREPDIPVITSGITNGATDGGTIRIVIENRDAVSADYKELWIARAPATPTIRHGSNTAARRTCAAEGLSPDA